MRGNGGEERLPQGRRRASGSPGDSPARESLAPGPRAAGSRCWGEEPAVSAALVLLQAGPASGPGPHGVTSTELKPIWASCLHAPLYVVLLHPPLPWVLPHGAPFPLSFVAQRLCGSACYISTLSAPGRLVPVAAVPQLPCPVSHQCLCLNSSCPANQSLT